MENGTDFTHVVLTYKSQKIEILSRVGDGIVIGQRKGYTVVYGEEPNKKTSRVFVDDEHASRYLRGKVALDDLKSKSLDGPVLIEDRDAEGLVVLPADIMELPTGNGGSFRMN